MKVTVDIVIFSLSADTLRVLLVRRRIDPYKNSWAIPGGFVLEDESLEQAAKRELMEECGVKNVYLEQLFTFGAPNRDPRGRVITVSYFAIVPAGQKVEAGSDASEAGWFNLYDLPRLAFDHKQIIEYSLERLRNKLEYTTVGFKLLAEKFTLGELQRAYELVLNKELDKRNFRRKIKLIDVLEPLKETRQEGISRPAQLFRLSEKKFAKLRDKGILFPF